MPSPSSPSPVPRAREIFLEAVEKHSPAEREAFLDNACRGDGELRAAVEKMLADHGADPVLENPDLSLPTVILPAREQPGERIGRYKLLQEIGEGGFGTVWMAEQVEPVTRRVALKIIKLGMDTREVIARFEAERQALAMMDHPNIAKVFDAGATDRGRPYFVMELVKGMPVTRFCDDTGLSVRERLALFGDVCSAISHAHQKGIIHRDIKPSNVMVTLYADRPVIKVIDFGIAKATQGKLTDKTLFTRFEQFVGTPVYMSPEQAALSGVDIDTRSDIYALGILLYELLTGKPPFDAKTLASAGYDEMRRIIREVEPPKPSSRLSTVAGEERTALAKARQIAPEKLARLVEPDLDWIVMKAIEKDRTRRYETANALAQDIQRFLADEPVSASPPGAAYKFRKFARRNKAALRVAAAIAAVLVAATAVSTWQAVQATRAKEKTAETLTQVSAERDAKEQARQDAEAIAEFLSDVFQSPDPSVDGREIKVAALLDRAVRKLDTDLATQPARRAKLQAALGRTCIGLGLIQQSIPLHEKVRDYYLSTLGPEHRETLSAMHNLANSYSKADRYDDAFKLRQEVLAVRRRVSGPEHPETLDAMHNLAASLRDAGRYDDALKRYEELLTLRRKVNGPEHPDTLMTMNNLATSRADAGHNDEALKMYEEVLAIGRRVNGPEHPGTLSAMHNVAASLADAGRDGEAIKRYEEVLALRHRILGPEHPDTLLVMNNLAGCYAPAGRQEDAIKLLNELIPLSREVNGPEHIDTLGAMTNLAFSYLQTGREADALPVQEQALAIKRRVLPPNHPYLLSALHNMAEIHQKSGRHADAIKFREEVLALILKAGGPDHPGTLGATNTLAWLLATCPDAALRNPARAAELASGAVKLDPNDPGYAATLGAAQYRTGSYPAAIASLEKALALWKDGDSATAFFLAMARWQQGDKDQARKDYARALAWMEKDQSSQDELRRFKAEAAALLGE